MNLNLNLGFLGVIFMLISYLCADLASQVSLQLKKVMLIKSGFIVCEEFNNSPQIEAAADGRPLTSYAANSRSNGAAIEWAWQIFFWTNR